MSHVEQFLDSFKQTLKAKNIVYKDLAKILKLSESSIKRLLSDKSLSLERIEEICKACDVSFAEICQNAKFESPPTVQFLSHEQEKILAENPRLLHYFILLNDNLSPVKIEKEFEISNTEAKKFLLQLDKLNIIELYPKDRIKWKGPAEGFRFRRDGAVGKILFNQTKNDYLHYDFDKEQDFIRFTLLHTPVKNLNRYKKKIEKLIIEIQDELRFVDEVSSGEMMDIGILTAFRPWRYNTVDVLKKRK